MSNQWTAVPLGFPSAVPNSPGIPKDVPARVLIAPFNDVETTTALVERYHDALAAVIVEPLQRTIPPRPGFLEAVRETTRRFDIPLVFDEVVTGFRLALGGAQERYGVTPDLCALGKSISAGHPLGVVCGRHDLLMLAAGPDGVRLTGTFSANPVSASAALACIGELRNPGCYERLASRGERLMQALQRALDDARIPARVTGEPSVFQPWFTDQDVVDHRSTLAANARLAHAFVDRLLDAGVVKGHEKFFLSTAHTEADIELTIAAFEQAVGRLRTARAGE